MKQESELPVRWMAPETLREGLFSARSDVWMLGVTLWEMLARSVPYMGASNSQAAARIAAGELLEIPEHTPPKLAHILLSCWRMLPQERPDMAQVLELLIDCYHHLKQDKRNRKRESKRNRDRESKEHDRPYRDHRRTHTEDSPHRSTRHDSGERRERRRRGRDRERTGYEHDHKRRDRDRDRERERDRDDTHRRRSSRGSGSGRRHRDGRSSRSSRDQLEYGRHRSHTDNRDGRASRPQSTLRVPSATPSPAPTVDSIIEDEPMPNSMSISVSSPDATSTPIVAPTLAHGTSVSSVSSGFQPGSEPPFNSANTVQQSFNAQEQQRGSGGSA